LLSRRQLLRTYGKMIMYSSAFRYVIPGILSDMKDTGIHAAM